MATVTLKGIKKIYDNNVTAVHDFDLEIADKEFVVLVGPSGCGKSTTLRMVAGLEEISGGELYIDDKRVRQAADILDITEYLGRKPKALSGGQRQRVAIGRAIVREPRVFLMDEPLSNLDAKLRNQMRSEIIKLRQRIDTTFIYVTHDQTEAMTLGDRIVIMKDGFIQQIGTPREVFEHPANIFVAGFIGMPQMNFFEDAELVREGNAVKVKLQNALIELDAEKGKAFIARMDGTTKKVVAGIRPVHIHLAETAGEHTMDGVVDVSEMMGSEIHLHVNAGGKDVVLVLATTDLPADWRGGIPYGTTIHFSTSGDLIHLFDPETEENLISIFL